MRTHFGARSTLTGNQGVILRLCNLIPRRTTFSWDSRKVHYQRFNLGAKFNENSLTTECCFAEIRGWVCNQGRRREVIALLRCPCFAMDHQVCVCACTLSGVPTSEQKVKLFAFLILPPAPNIKMDQGGPQGPFLFVSFVSLPCFFFPFDFFVCRLARFMRRAIFKRSGVITGHICNQRQLLDDYSL